MKNVFIIFSSLLFCFSTHAQRSSDLGIIISSNSESRFTLEYRKPIGEKYNLKFGSTFGNLHSSIFNPWNIEQSTDSIILFGRKNSSENFLNFKFGVERTIKSSPFSVGLDLLLGYKNAKHYKSVRHYELGPMGKWDYTHFGEKDAGTLIKTDSSFGKIIFHYFIPALQLNLGLDLPLAKRFIVNLSYQYAAGVLLNTGETRENNSSTEFDYLKKTKLTFNSRFNVGLRYKFNVKD